MNRLNVLPSVSAVSAFALLVQLVREPKAKSAAARIAGGDNERHWFCENYHAARYPWDERRNAGCLPDGLYNPIARLTDRHCDVALVGDSVGMVLHGFPSTLPFSLNMMILHGRAVRREITRALLVVDLPFGTYEAYPEEAFRSVARVMAETGAGAVKLEGGATMASTIRFLVQYGIPVMAHIGLTPQSVHVLGGYGVQGRCE